VSAWAVLREARAEAGLSQRALAARAGVAQSEIARIENGRQEPSHDRLVRLVRSAGFDLRVALVLRDNHDAQLVNAMLDTSVDERLDSLEEQAEFFGAAREAARG
jgi:transcriptional regulator with XRE-family HTH domain